jgi:UDP-N-acetylmuramoyl-L-alanyl-D-glutamate--2,6-diaminopimelate ligase
MSATLGELFAAVPEFRILGDAGVCPGAPVTDSRRVAPGSLFFAIGGLRTAGAEFVGDAVLRGAAAVVIDDASKAPAEIPSVVVPDVRKALALVSREFFGRPDESLQVLGVTGTNGKTTVSMLVRHLLQSGGKRWGLVGTVRYELGDRSIPSHKTTPESVDIYGMMAGMVRSGCEGLSMEVSSHAVDQDRVHGLRFKAVAFTNLSRDHMDYHGDMEAYFAVKSRVFAGAAGVAPEFAVINTDDTWGARLAKGLAGSDVALIRFGTGADADVRAENVTLGAGGSEFDVVWSGGRAHVVTRLPGHYNVSNILCALALCHAAGRDIATLAPLLEKFPGVPGRMEKVVDGLPFEVLVDYAHTDDALRNALGMLRSITPGRLLVVFGCGGNRDRGKRPKMTGAVQEYADFAWATADNPRREDLAVIFDDMRTGITRPEAIDFVPDRRRAISRALDAARPGDCVIIAGKGHETYQEFADTTVPFDDREVARELLELKSLRAR